MVDITKFKKLISKNITNGSVGFHDPKTWISSGSYALNYTVSGDFHKAFPLGKVSIVAGSSGCLPEYAKIKIRIRRKQ